MLDRIPLWAIIGLALLSTIVFSLKILRAKIQWEIVKSKQYSKGQLISGRAVYGQVLGYDAPVSEEPSYKRSLLISRIGMVIGLIGLLILLILRLL